MVPKFWVVLDLTDSNDTTYLRQWFAFIMEGITFSSRAIMTKPLPSGKRGPIVLSWLFCETRVMSQCDTLWHVVTRCDTLWQCPVPSLPSRSNRATTKCSPSWCPLKAGLRPSTSKWSPSANLAVITSDNDSAGWCWIIFWRFHSFPQLFGSSDTRLTLCLDSSWSYRLGALQRYGRGHDQLHSGSSLKTEHALPGYGSHWTDICKQAMDTAGVGHGWDKFTSHTLSTTSQRTQIW